jgi:hypothetical protein
LPQEIKALPRRLRVIAQEVWWAILDLLEKGQAATTEAVTDAVLAAHSGWSRSYVQHGLWILEYVAKVIKRTRRHGRRIIKILVQLWGRRDRQPRRVAVAMAGNRDGAASHPAPPHTPPEKKKEKTTTKTAQSSSHEETRKKTPGPDDPAIASLINRACGLVLEATPGQVATAIDEFTAEWVSLALDRVEKRNRTPGKKPVTSWGFVLGILRNRRREGWTPPEPKPVTQQPTAPKAPAEPSAPPRLLTAEDVAGLVATGHESGHLGRIARVYLREAIHAGGIPADLMGMIPAEILAGWEVPAAGSGS